MRSLRTGFLLFLALLAGCASNPAQAPNLVGPGVGKAVVYIYRVDRFIGEDTMAPNVRVNYESLGPLLRRGYMRVEVNPGATQVALYMLDQGDGTFWPAEQDVVLSLELAPARTYFVELLLTTSTFSFKETTREIALQSLPDLNLLN